MKTKHIAQRSSSAPEFLFLFSSAQIFGGSHGRTDVGLLLMIIRLVAQRNLLFHELPEPLAVDAPVGGAGGGVSRMICAMEQRSRVAQSKAEGSRSCSM